jgi:phage gp29-like protein
LATDKKSKALPAPELDTEVASRLLDPFEQTFMGILRSSDMTLLEKGGPDAYAIYNDLKRDPTVFSALQKRRLALISCPWNITCTEKGAAGDAAAQVVAEIFRKFAFDQTCQDLMDAVLKGYAVSEIVWTVRDNMIAPLRIVKRAQRRFRYVQKDKDLPPELRLLTQANMLDGEQLPDRKFIVHRFNPEDDNPYGVGLGQQLYWPVYFKRGGIKSWAKFCDRFGSPTPWGKYPKGADKTAKSTLFSALQSMSNDGVVMTPEGMSIELLQAASSGSITTQADLCKFMDDQINAAVLGQDAQSGRGGALAAASKERQDVRIELVQADSDLLSDTLNSTLIAWICEYNGLPPCQLYREIKKEEDLKQLADTDKVVYDMGFEPSLDYIRSRYGEGWSKRTVPNASLRLPGADFAEHPPAQDQVALDDAVAKLNPTALNEAAQAMIQPVLDAIDGAVDFDDALSKLEAAFPKMDSVKLQGLIAEAMFGAEAFGRVAGEA